MPPSNYKPVTHVIFDMDGLLLNTEDLYTEIYEKVCSKYGKVYDWSIKLPIMGKKQTVAAQYVIDTLELPVSVEEWFKLVHAEYDIIFPTAKLLPGAERLVKHLHSNNIPIAICTGSSAQAFNQKTTHHKPFMSLFKHIVLCSDDPEVIHGKPHPDAYQVTCRRFEPAPSVEKVLVFEDAPNGVKSALSAGMQVVYIPHLSMPDTGDLNSTLRIKSLENFQPELFGLPSF